MFDSFLSQTDYPKTCLANKDIRVGGSPAFWLSKRLFDIALSICLLPLLLFFLIVVSTLNLFKNPGPLFFVQTRTGRDCKPFRTLKFRSMTVTTKIERGPDDPIEQDRITSFGRLLRKSRVDELPQILNVLKGDMSLIGPRPDYYDHAVAYLEAIPEYRARHTIVPGISGWAQVELGYVEGSDATRAKARQDLEYIRQAGFLLDMKIVFLTLKVVCMQSGA